MANAVWFEIPGTGQFPNAETARDAARETAKASDGPVEIYRCTRTLVRTVQRTVTIQETDVPT